MISRIKVYRQGQYYILIEGVNYKCTIVQKIKFGKTL